MEKEILEKYDQGCSVKEIVSFLNTSTSAVYRILKKHNKIQRKKFDLEKEVLEDLYLNQKLSMSEIARQYGVSKPIIEKLIKSKNIPVRSHKETCQIVNERKIPEIPSKEELEYLYSQMSIYDMYRYFNIGQKTLYNWFSYYNIFLETLSERCEKAKSRQFQDLKPNKEDLVQLYQKTKNIHHCANHFNTSYSYMRKIFDEYDIEKEIPWRSAEEISLFEYCKNLRPDLTWTSSRKDIIPPYEIDIFCEELNLTIEYCGLYWHSEYYGKKSKNYHKNKFLKCQEKNIDLITIFESDCKKKVRNLLSYKLHTLKNSVPARKCKVKKISSNTARIFNEKYHIHNHCNGSYNYGLYRENDLLMVCVFSKTRFSNYHDFEIIRMTVGSKNVIGGFSKILKQFRKEVGFDKSIETFADLRFGRGSVYEKAGFQFLENTPPNYWYFNKNSHEIFSRVSFQKHKLEKRLKVFDKNLTEYENMRINNYDRIWDCGNAKYVLNPTIL